MIILQIHNNHVFAIECEGNSPVSGNGHSPLPLPISLERVKIHARDIQLIRAARLIQSIKDAADSPGMRSLNTLCISPSEEPLKALVPESPDHGPECNALRSTMQYEDLHFVQ